MVYMTLVLSGFQYVPWAGTYNPSPRSLGFYLMRHSIFSVFYSKGPCTEWEKLAVVYPHIPPIIGSSGD